MTLLLAPGGSPAAVEAAIGAGADGVYVGVRGFSRREGVGLTEPELAGCIDLVHRRKRFLHLAVNVVPASRDLPLFQTALAHYAKWGIDGVVVNDPGLIAWSRRELPDLPVYASVGLCVLNQEDVRFYEDLGVTAVVLPPGSVVFDAPPIGLRVGLEVFCDLAVEPLLVGRCSLSSYFLPSHSPAVSVKRGAPCHQPCRRPWEYEGPAGDQAGHPFPWRYHTVEDMVPYLRAGVTLFKIQGRRLTAPAVAGLVKRYRRVLDEAREKTVARRD